MEMSVDPNTNRDHQRLLFVVSKRCPDPKKMAPPLASSLQKDELATTPAELPWCCDTTLTFPTLKQKTAKITRVPDILSAALQAVEGFEQGCQDLLGPAVGHEALTICYIVCTYPYNHIFSLHTSLVCAFEICNPSPAQLL